MTTDETNVAVDVGNSAVKVAVCHRSASINAAPVPPRVGRYFEGELPHQSFPLDQPRWSDEICRWVARHVDGAPISWWVSTVNHAASGPLRDAVTAAFGPASPGERWQVLSHDDVPLQTEVGCPHRLGIDRLIGAYAATLRFPAPVIVIDAGSAVTVDWVRNDPVGGPRFVGGAILPGIRLQHAALASGTEGLGPTAQRAGQVGLPDTAPGVASMNPGRDTEQAIRLGVLAAVAGGIDRLAEEYSQGIQTNQVAPQHPKNEVPAVVLAGGDGPRISPYLRTKHTLIPHLVSLGLMDLASRECQRAPGGLK